jgi:hypothetical protein
VIAPIRLKGILLDGVGAGEVRTLTNLNGDTTLFIGDVPGDDNYTFLIPEDGILFPKGIYC